MKKMTGAVAQTRCSDDIQKNYARAEDMVAAAARMGAQLIVFPEMMNYVDMPDPSSFEPVPGGEACSRIAAAAKAHHIWVNLGSIREETGDKPYNTAVLFSPDGVIKGIYRKLHLADMQASADRPADLESDRNRKGNKIVVVDTENCKIGMSICYDLRFPEIYSLMSEKGAQIICHPACFSAATGAAHWEVLLRSIAILNHCYVLACNHCGTNSAGMPLWGHSMIIDPWGTVIAEAGPEREALLVAEIDLAYCEELRRRLGCMTNRRTDVYILQELQHSI